MMHPFLVAQALIEYSFLDAMTTGIRQFEIWLADVGYTTWLMWGGAGLFVIFLWRFRPQR